MKKGTTFTIARDGATNEVVIEFDFERGLITLKQTVVGFTDSIVITREQAAKMFALATQKRQRRDGVETWNPNT